jgi:hypothetical protein
VKELKKKIRSINKPDLPEHLETLEISRLGDSDSFEMGKMESSIGRLDAKHVQFNEVLIKGVNLADSKLPFSAWNDVVFEKCW